MIGKCPRCGVPTHGSYTQDGIKWAICQSCMDIDRAMCDEESSDVMLRPAPEEKGE